MNKTRHFGDVDDKPLCGVQFEETIDEMVLLSDYGPAVADGTITGSQAFVGTWAKVNCDWCIKEAPWRPKGEGG